MLLHLESFVKERHAYYKESGVYLIDKDLERLLPFLDRLSLTDAEYDFIVTSQRRARKNRNRRLVMLVATVFLPITLGLAIFALYEKAEATTAQKLAEQKSKLAEQAAYEADQSADTAKMQKYLADKQTERARKSEKLALDRQKEIAQQNEKLKRQKAELDSINQVNARLAADVMLKNEVLERSLGQTNDALSNTKRTFKERIDNTEARLRGFQADEMYRLGNTIDGFNLAAYADTLSANVKSQQVLFQALRDYQNYGKAMFKPLGDKEKLLVQQQVVFSSQVLDLNSTVTLGNDKRFGEVTTKSPQGRINNGMYHQFDQSLLGVTYLEAVQQLLVLLPNALVQVNPNDFQQQRSFPLLGGETAIALSASPHQPEGLVFLANGKAMYYNFAVASSPRFAVREVAWEDVQDIIWGRKRGDDCQVLLKNGRQYVYTKAGTKVPMPQPALASSEYDNGYCWRLMPNGRLVSYRNELPTSQRFALGVPSQYWRNTKITTNRAAAGKSNYLLLWVRDHSLRLVKQEPNGWRLQDTIRFNPVNYRDNLIQMDFIPELNGIAAITTENKLFLYSMSVKKPLRQILLPQEERTIHAVSFTEDALRILVNGEDRVYLCDVSGAVLQRYTRYDSIVPDASARSRSVPAAFFVNKGEAVVMTHFNNAIERRAPVSGKGVRDFFYQNRIIAPFTDAELDLYEIPKSKTFTQKQ